MSVHTRRIWDIIYPEFIDKESNTFGDIDKFMQKVLQTRLTELPQPTCRKCHGKGTRGTAYTQHETTALPNQPPKGIPITFDDWKNKKPKSNILWCSCIRRELDTAKALAEEHNNKQEDNG